MPADKPALGPYVLPPLRFGFDALEPSIDAATMRLHHDKHHQGYVDKVNEALAKHPEHLGKTIEEVLRGLDDLPEDIRQTVRDQGGGHANHQFFWKILTPGGSPEGPQVLLKEAIGKEWGSVDAFKAAFQAAGASRFGSGWVFLVARPKQDFRLEIFTRPNQDSVLLEPEPAPGLLCCDLWEHAYYLKHRNVRADWLRSFWNVVNWPYVGERLQGVHEGRKQL